MNFEGAIRNPAALLPWVGPGNGRKNRVRLAACALSLLSALPSSQECLPGERKHSETRSQQMEERTLADKHGGSHDYKVPGEGRKMGSTGARPDESASYP